MPCTSVALCTCLSSPFCDDCECMDTALQIGISGVEQVAGETEVKAQIKLRFRSTAGAPIVVIRTFQVTAHSCCPVIR